MLAHDAVASRSGGPAPRSHPIPSLLQIIYSSRPFGYDAATLSGILLHARQANPRDGITGALICRRDIYLQLLEGPAAAVKAAFARIRRDDRHLDIRLHVSEAVTTRLFADWAMLHDPARSVIWPEAELTDARLAQLTPAEARQVFVALAAEVRRVS
jgi:hypothetical protein